MTAIENAIENVQITAKEPLLPVLERLGITREEAMRNVLKLSGGRWHPRHLSS